MTIANRHTEMRGLVDPETALVDRRIFSDQEIYEMELEQIFARAWNFICHESQIPNPGRLLHDLHRRRPRHLRAGH